MKKIVCQFCFVIVFVITASCSEDFSPNAPLDDIYVLNCILRGDTTIQFATITKNYEVGNADPSVKGATIIVSYNDSLFVMRDTVLQTVNQGYNTSINCYYVKGLTPKLHKYIEIRALLPNGKSLKASTQTFKVQGIYFFGSDETIPPGPKPPGRRQDNLEFMWTDGGGVIKSSQSFFFTKLQFFYSKKVNGKTTNFSIDVPQTYIEYYGKSMPIYPKGSNDNFTSFNMEAIRMLLQNISVGDPQKSNYTIEKALFTVLVLDDNLSAYYTATEGFSDLPTVALAPSDYTNIQGGRGVFGTMLKLTYEPKFDYNFIKSFGYDIH